MGNMTIWARPDKSDNWARLTGSNYEKPKDCDDDQCKSYLAGQDKFQLLDFEVYELYLE